MDENVVEKIINKFLSVRLEDSETHIYMDGELFTQCSFLLLNIPKEIVNQITEIDSIDKTSQFLGPLLEGNGNVEHFDLTPEEEFWGHASNFQAWAENNYDTQRFCRNLAFPLLKRLTEAGDPQATRTFKDEIAKRFESGHVIVNI